MEKLSDPFPMLIINNSETQICKIYVLIGSILLQLVKNAKIKLLCTYTNTHTRIMRYYFQVIGLNCRF